MSWKAITNRQVLEELLHQVRVGVRMVCLSPPGDRVPFVVIAGLPAPQSLEEMRAQYRSLGFRKRYELHVLDTDPGSVLVLDDTEHQVVGAYVWTGRGGRIPSTADSRVVQLADALEADFIGEPAPQFHEPECTCSECGESFNPGEKGPALLVEEDLGNGVRGSVEDLTQEQLVERLCQYCTDGQIRAVERWCGKKGWHFAGLVNQRVAGGPAIQNVSPVIEDEHEVAWMVNPAGNLVRLD